MLAYRHQRENKACILGMHIHMQRETCIHQCMNETYMYTHTLTPTHRRRAHEQHQCQRDRRRLIQRYHQRLAESAAYHINYPFFNFTTGVDGSGLPAPLPQLGVLNTPPMGEEGQGEGDRGRQRCKMKKNVQEGVAFFGRSH